MHRDPIAQRGQGPQGSQTVTQSCLRSVISSGTSQVTSLASGFPFVNVEDVSCTSNIAGILWVMMHSTQSSAGHKDVSTRMSCPRHCGWGCMGGAGGL